MMIRRYKLALLALGLTAALLAPVLIMPQDLERAIVLKSDGYQTAAHNLLRDLYLGGDQSETIVYELVQQELDLGEVEIASRILVDYSSERPDLSWPRLEFLNIRQSYGTEDERIAALLEARNDHAGKNSVHGLTQYYRNTRVLAEHYRITGDHVREAEIIEETISSGFASADDMFRLGVIKASTGQLADGIKILQSLDDRLPDNAIRQRLTLYSMLISDGRPHDAFRYAQRWQSKWDEPWIEYELKEIMTALGYPDIAAGLVSTDPASAGQISSITARPAEFNDTFREPQ